MSAALMVTIDQWREHKGSYDEDKVVQLACIIEKYQLHGRRVRELLYEVLSLLTGQPIVSLQEQLPLPSYTTQQRAVHATAFGRHQQLCSMLGKQELVGLECDEGAFARQKHFVVLLLQPYRQRHFLGAPTITDTSAQTQLNALLESLDQAGKGLHQLLYMVSDSAAPLVMAARLLQQRKLALFESSIPSCRRPTVNELPTDLHGSFLVVESSGFLLPSVLLRHADIIHIAKNAEVHALREGLGGGAHPANGRFFGDLAGALCFQFARLVAGSLEFRDIMRSYCPAARMLQTIPGKCWSARDYKRATASVKHHVLQPSSSFLAFSPPSSGVVKHRLLIKPTLASIVTEYYDVILHSLWNFNVAYGNSRWAIAALFSPDLLSLPTWLLWLVSLEEVQSHL
eukprot:1139408-Pelagomonas_calceolata.AAC.3